MVKTRSFDAGTLSWRPLIGVAGPGVKIVDLVKFLMFSVRAMMMIGMTAAWRSVDIQFLKRRKRRFFLMMVLVCFASLRTEKSAMALNMPQGAESTICCCRKQCRGIGLAGSPLN